MNKRHLKTTGSQRIRLYLKRCPFKMTVIAAWLSLPLWIMLAITPVLGQTMETPSAIRLMSDTPTLRFNNLGIKDGLAQSSANNIMQDSRGYLWITTQGGLHRYDGYEFKVFSSIPFDTTSLSDDWVWTVTESRTGGLWITTEIGGLNYMDPTTGTFKHYRFDPENPNSLSSNTVYHVLESSDGDLWVSTLNGGHNLPYIASAEGEVTEIEDIGGLLLGKFENAPYQKGIVQLNPGDTIVTFTDGVTEAENESADFFDEERVINYLKKSGSRTLDSQVKGLFLEVMKFAGSATQSDDITVLSVRYNGNK